MNSKGNKKENSNTQPKEIKIDNPILNMQKAVSLAAVDTAVKAEIGLVIGDCIDCNLCVKVCPTGIDIRNGTQLECVNCTACIDACDEVMVKINRPTGLIRYASQTMIEEEKPFEFTRRMKSYSIVLTLLLGVLCMSLAMRSDMEVTILRAPGMLYQEINENTISNFYTYQIVNKTNKNLPIELRITDKKGTIRLVGNEDFNVKKQDIIKGAFFIDIDKVNLNGRKNSITVEIWSNDKKIDQMKTNFNYK